MNHKKIIIIICSVLCMFVIIDGVFIVTKNFYENKIEELEEEQSDNKKNNKNEEKENEKNEEKENEEKENEENEEVELKEEVVKEYVIPNVKGRHLNEVIAELRNMGFEIADSVIEINDDKVSKGDVVKTNPPSGAKRTKGTSITIYVSAGASKYTVENLTGKNYIQVRGKLEAYGINVHVEKKDVTNPDDYVEGTIIEQSIPAGEKLEAKDEITLYIPNIEVKYPDFTDPDGAYTEEDVRKFCDSYNIKLTILYEESSNESGTIISQSKPKGSVVLPGSTFKIVIAS